MGGLTRDLHQSFHTSVLLKFQEPYVASVRNAWSLPSPHVFLCTDSCVSLQMMKNLFKLNSSGNVRQKKHATMQNTVFSSEMTMKKRKIDTSAFFISVHRRILQILLEAS